MSRAPAGFTGPCRRLLTDSPIDGLAGTVRFDWAALDAWSEEDEPVFVPPRSPYVRVDALRSNHPVRVEFGGVVLAGSPSPMVVFETGAAHPLLPQPN